MLEIMKAAAGSGKTFNLARKYITLLFKKQDRYSYRHILAVTFTNKATDEMKNRILKELYILASDTENSGYLKYFMPELFGAEELSDIKDEDFVRELPAKPGRKITMESLAESAETILCNILHDYSAFAVSTIDRFFQQTLKAFSREIGQFASYQVELDKDSLVAESVDRVLDSLTESDAGLLRWLTDSVIENIELGGRYNLESSLISMASRLKSDEHRVMVEKTGIDESSVYSPENLSSIRKACAGVIKDFEVSVREKAAAALKILLDAGVDPSESNRGFLKSLFRYSEPSRGEAVKAPTESFMSKASDPDKWFAKSKSARKSLVYPFLEAPLNDFCNMFGTPFKVYNTALILREQLYSLGIAGELYKEFNSLMKEKNVLSIDDSNTILKGIIDGSDAPFVYEKLGVRFENFLLDEFQDTSRIQWDNFRPLLGNSESQGHENLIVGDVKQSIYRWRGSDWNLFHSELQKEFVEVRNTDLDTNYRSLKGIVDFNNSFFPAAASALDMQYGAKGDESGSGGEDSISRIYSGVSQKVPSRVKDTGIVDMTFCDKDKECEAVLETIRRLEAAGVPRGDIAVLVRNNASGGAIAAYLIENDVDILTDDSLRVKSSVTVRRAVSLLSYYDNPADTVNGYLALSMGISNDAGFRSLVDLCENVLRDVRAVDEEAFESEVLHIQSFMDYVQDYVAADGNDLHGFLKAWADADPKISSPAVADAVRIMTIHKSKGLAFPYVIFPYVESVTLFKPGRHWCSPDLKGTPLEGRAEGLYDVNLSSGSEASLFEDDYRTELKLQYVDNINTVYVAFTRPEKGLFLISGSPSVKFAESLDNGGVPAFSDFSQVLYWFASGNGMFSGGRSVDESGAEHFSYGEIKAFPANRKDSGAVSLQSGYPSWPLNPEEGEGRLKLNMDAADFFSADGEAGIASSARIKGIVLHDILSGVILPSDLGNAVEKAVFAGDMGREEADDAYRLLSERIAHATQLGWFPDEPASVRNEVTLIDTDGSMYRPDRVVESEGRVMIIDYKFGEHRKSYERQVARYADIYRRMGYSDVTAALWYVMPDKVVWFKGLQ